MRIISWNINGIRACLKKGFIEFLKKNKPDILGVQEIKICKSARTREKIEGISKNYTEYWNSAKKPGYSGTMSLVKNLSSSAKEELDLKSLKVVSEVNGLGVIKFDIEGRVQTIEFDKFYFLNIYFPNANHELSRLDYKEEFNKEFLKYIKKLDKIKPIIACGDFNVAHKEIDLKNHKTNIGNAGFTNIERAWMDKFLKAGFIDAFRHFHPNKTQYTWWSYRFKARARNIGWRIDYFLVSAKIIPYVKDVYVLDDVMGSDHAPVVLEARI